ncbi:MAG: hypothetical protein II966_05095 [Lachnospiraceae bacterium]|nr:hypothetical protein [Lachnospiraceae bacterium]
MANRRINEITKELVADGHKITNKDVIAFLDAQGIEGRCTAPWWMRASKKR